MRAEVEDLRQTNEELVSSLREKSRKLAQTQELYEKLKRQALLEEIEHTASQIVGSNIEVATSAGTMLVDQPLGRQHMYPRGTVASPRYTNAQLSPNYTLDSRYSPRMNPAVSGGGMNHAYSNPYPGIQPLQNTITGRTQPRGELGPTV
jgi:E3 ubiquitin-protein ligase CCNP1IP1